MGNILIAHESKVIRAALARYLEASHTTQEVLDGDSAWHALVLDHDITAVIAGPDLARLDGMSLLNRLRHSNLERLKHLPFYLIGSESRISILADTAKEEGVTGLLFNNMGKQDILSILNQQDTADTSSQEAPSGQETHLAAKKSKVTASTPVMGDKGRQRAGFVTRKNTTLLSVTLFADGVRRMCSRQGGQNAVMIFALDGYSALAARLGAHTVSAIIEQLAGPVQKKINASDVIGHYQPGCFAIATMNSSLETCAVFAKRVALGLSSANITFHGEPVHISISVGIASRPEDGDVDGDVLLNLAKARLDAAIAAGGGRIQTHGGK
jgi:diguanylate cyclase (GGDEF)-like protein